MRHLQPLLHDLVPTIAAPTTALSGADGQIRPAGVQGVFHADRRVLSAAVLRLDGREPEPIGWAAAGPGATRFVAVARWLGDEIADPTVRVVRTRRVRPGAVDEEIEVASTATVPVTTTVTVETASDLAPIEAVRSGRAAAPGPGNVTVRVDPFRTWEVTLAPGQSTVLRWSATVDDPDAVMLPGPRGGFATPVVRAHDRRLERLVAQSVDDLAALRLTTAIDDGDTFLGAGVPWYLTLFGRDSLWAARMMLPLGTDLALGTLRALARRQGSRIDPATGEAPGKIMHELRRSDVSVDGRLPATYYGTIDATLLWISLLHDAWRWGLESSLVEELLPHLEAALGWLAEHADPDGDGFLEYRDESGRGLANQGWKDSGDAVRFHDGRLAAPPIALAEVQGYAYRAAVDGAALLDAFGRPGGDRWRSWAAAMATRFRAAFWVSDDRASDDHSSDNHASDRRASDDRASDDRVSDRRASDRRASDDRVSDDRVGDDRVSDDRVGDDRVSDGRFPALALDRDKRPVDSLTSNAGHLLGTGLLTPAEEASVAAALAGPAMSGGYGLRTMSSADRGFAPLSYHCGSIWAHDTAIVAAGLARGGFAAEALTLFDGLLTAAESFNFRLPELYAGDARTDLSRPVPYPAACHPQAWSAAAAILILQAWLGLDPDVPNGIVRLSPLPGAPSVDGLQIAGRSVSFDGKTLTGLPDDLRLG